MVVESIFIVNNARKFAEDIVICVMDWHFKLVFLEGDSQDQAGEFFGYYRQEVIEYCYKNKLAMEKDCWLYFNKDEVSMGKQIENYDIFCSFMKSYLRFMELSIDELLLRVLKLAVFAAHLCCSGCEKAPNLAIKRIEEIMLIFPNFFRRTIP